MSNEITIILCIFIFGFIFNYILTSILIKYSKTLGLIDFPDQRKMHTESMPVVGGLSIFITVFIFSLFYFILFYNHSKSLVSIEQIMVLYISTFIIIITGLFDDIRGIGPFNKFLFQLIASSILLIGYDLHLESMFGLGYSALDFVINIFFIVGITNAFNLLDGLDGLAGGVSLIISITMSILFFLSGYSIIELGNLLLIISCLISFLFFNRSPAKTFLGDTGSLFLGWVFAINSIYFFEKVTLSLSILLPLMIMGLPAFDVLFVMISRFTKRHKYNIPLLDRFKSMFKPDNTHLHHLMIRGGISKFKTVVLLYLITSISCIVCVLFWFNHNHVNLFYGLLFILLLIFIIRLYGEFRIKNSRFKR